MQFPINGLTASDDWIVCQLILVNIIYSLDQFIADPVKLWLFFFCFFAIIHHGEDAWDQRSLII